MIHLIFFLSLFTVLNGCTHNLVTRQPASVHPLMIFDAHTHFDIKNSLDQPSERMLQEFEEAGVKAAVVHLGKSKNKSLRLKLPNQKVRFILCAGIGPKGESASGVEKRLKNGFYGCLKIYLGYVPKYATDPFYKPFYLLAQKYKVPVVFHTGDTYDKTALIKYADPLQIDEIAVTYPKVKFVLAHMGNPWFDSAAEVIYKNDNVFVDLSALMLEDVSIKEPEQVDYLITKPVRWVFHFVENPKKFLFGSDWPLTKILTYIEAIKRGIPEKHWEDVFYWNAMEVFFNEKKP